jgi:hypothetical protein
VRRPRWQADAAGHGTTRGLDHPPGHERRFRERVRRPYGLDPRPVGEFLLELPAEVRAPASVAERTFERHAAPAPGLVEAAGGRDRLDQATVAVWRDLLVGEGEEVPACALAPGGRA